MSEYAPLRDAFHELNRLLIDKQQWDAEHELRKEDMGLKRLQVASQMQDQELKRKTLEKEAALAQDQMTPVDVSIYDYIPNNDYTQKKLFDQTDAGIRFAKLMGGADINRATGQIVDSNGDPIRGPKSLVATRAGRAYGVISAAMDPEEMINENINAASSRIQEMEAQLNSIPSVDIAKRAELKTRIAEAKNTLKEHYNMLEPEQLEPMYRQRMKLIDSMSLNVAASGGDKDILTALQQSAQRANSDYLTIVQRKMQKEEKERDRALRRWQTEEASRDRAASAAATVEAARIRAAGTASTKEKDQQHLAIRLDSNGQIRDSEWVNVPKGERGGSYTPESINPSLKGYVWSDQHELANRNLSSQNVAIGTALRSLEQAFETENSMGQKGMAPADIPRLEAAKMYFKSTGKGNEFKDAANTAAMILGAEKDFWDEVKAEVRKQAINIGKPEKEFTPEEWNFIASKLATRPGGYHEEFKYVPKYEDRLSLDRNLLSSPLRPKVVE